MTPTQRSLKMLRDDGWHCWIVEHFNPHVKPHGIRQDMFGCIDILCIRGPETLAVQTTSGSAVSAHLKKMEANEYLPRMRDANWTIHLHGWRKVKVKRGGKATRWDCRVVDLS